MANIAEGVQQAPFTDSVPILCVQDLMASLEHYQSDLGFQVVWTWSNEQHFEGGKPSFACVCRGQVSVFLCEQGQGQPGAWMSLFLNTLADLDAVYKEYQQSGADIAEPPTDRPWGMREMFVRDIDGNVFRIGASLEDEDE